MDLTLVEMADHVLPTMLDKNMAEVQIEVKVGQAGSISLSLCNDCVRKFSDENAIH
jgi:hypothetical protein